MSGQTQIAKSTFKKCFCLSRHLRQSRLIGFALCGWVCRKYSVRMAAVLDDEAMEIGFDDFQSLSFFGEGTFLSDLEYVDSSSRKVLGSDFLDRCSFLKCVSRYCSCQEWDLPWGKIRTSCGCHSGTWQPHKISNLWSLEICCQNF